MSLKRNLFRLFTRMKEIVGFVVNWPLFKIWRIEYSSFPTVRGKIKISNYGRIHIGRNVMINSNLESSQLGFYPKTILHTSSTGVIQIGDDSGISNSCINSRYRVIIGSKVKLGAGVKIYDNDFHNVYDFNNDSPDTIPTAPVIIEDNVFIGAGSIVLKGTHIGRRSIIGAGSVVTGIIPDREVWAGNPAKKIKDL